MWHHTDLLLSRGQAAKGNAKGDDPAEMERQLEVLKVRVSPLPRSVFLLNQRPFAQNADHELFANTALRTKVLKDKLLAHNDDIVAAMEDKLPAARLVAPQEPGSAEAKVHGRLLSSKTLAEAVQMAVEALKEAADPSLAKGKRKTAGEDGSEDNEESEEESDSDEDGEDEEIEARPAKTKKARLEVSRNEDKDEQANEESGSEADGDDAGWESGTVDGGEDAGGESWESGSLDDDNIHLADSSDEDTSDEEDGDEDEDESGSEEARPPAKSTTKLAPSSSKDKSKAKAGESTFLPSLSVGFTRGDSDASDLSDGETNVADAPRKNRRGQRARRQYVFPFAHSPPPLLLLFLFPGLAPLRNAPGPFCLLPLTSRTSVAVRPVPQAHGPAFRARVDPVVRALLPTRAPFACPARSHGSAHAGSGRRSTARTRTTSRSSTRPLPPMRRRARRTGSRASGNKARLASPAAVRLGGGAAGSEGEGGEGAGRVLVGRVGAARPVPMPWPSRPLRRVGAAPRGGARAVRTRARARSCTRPGRPRGSSRRS